MPWMSWHASFRVGVSVLGSTSIASNLSQPKLAEAGITKSWCRLVEMSSRQSIHKRSNSQAVEGLLFKEKLLNLRHQPFGTFALTPRCTTCTRAPSQHRIMDVIPMIETFITETSRQRNSAASILARFGKALISVKWTCNVGGIISGETVLK